MTKLNKKAFTLIELIVAMAVIGILTLLAVPKIVSHSQEAKLKQIQNDTKVAETVVQEYMIKNDDKLPESEGTKTKEELIAEIGENKLFNYEGLVEDEEVLNTGLYKIMSKDFIKKNTGSKLKGEFVSNAKGDVFFISAKAIGGNKVNKDDLASAIEDAKKKQEGDYVTGWEELQDAITEVEAVNNEDSSQSEIDKALKDLENAINNLVKKPVNKDDLIAKKEDADGLKEADYSEGFESLQPAIDRAQSIIDNPEATQKEVGEALTDLNDAIGGLVEKPSFIIDALKEVEVDRLIAKGYIPISSGVELNNIRDKAPYIYGKNTKWEKEYIGGLDKQYVQIANIDLKDYSKGEGWTPLNNFKGTYDGLGFDVLNLKINTPKAYEVGLFGGDFSGVIINAHLEDVDIVGSEAVGGLIGGTLYSNGGNVERSSVTGKIVGKEMVGGLVGNNTARIANCYTKVSIESENIAGGIVGIIFKGNIVDSYSASHVITTGDAVGGILGAGAPTKKEVVNSYFDKGIYQNPIPQNSEWKGTALTSLQMKQKGSYKGWDFNSIWEIKEGQYPTLR